MMWIIFVGLLIIIAWIGYRIYQRSIDAEVHSSNNWFLQRVPFSRARRDSRNNSGSRAKMEYDPEADYESTELFYHKKPTNDKVGK
ncbi:hypothetical protein I4Q36_07615 [Tuanshanicoccus lijuaniae]|uniref:hypothetical protein n=1 Tax=Aerococcaceae bacterium zg-1292 TaxID=2774330 RepID=UPI001936781C|nr:hypothetical protein [Aerococcaceae bacterium zg-1292]MBF6978726.1 hypothetical protein [Aerococcaceae bacterium zg-BR22]MBS4456853.1 hypothetical protein [Aerococcaceae bacterium zg-A91]MBS4458669.1 hypothetical protein [Aerococcaceae bacterium zg-BR33]QQA36658.1 hypothetical protein I4Q36_07615 [Aerococcaceae bacterium zg-1292]